MQQTTPEQIRAVQERTAKVLEPRTPAGSDAPAGKRWVSESAPRDGDRHFRAAATGPALFASQYFDVMLREAPEKSNNWAIWWSDLMMTMFIMFAALYAFQMPKDILPPKVVTAPLPPGESVVPPVPVDGESILVRTYDALRERVQAAGLEGVLAVRLIPEKAVRVTIAGDVLPGRRQDRTQSVRLASVACACGCTQEIPVQNYGHRPYGQHAERVPRVAHQLGVVHGSSLWRGSIFDSGRRAGSRSVDYDRIMINSRLCPTPRP